MPRVKRVLLIVGILLIVAIGGAIAYLTLRHKGGSVNDLASKPQTFAGFTLTSPAFLNGKPIPVKYTCKAENLSPPLQIVGRPVATRSFALILHDPDAVGNDFTHWTVWNISASTQNIDEGRLPPEATVGANGTDNSGYIGPCPPAGTGTHHYIFDLYALDTNLNLPTGASVAQLRAAMRNHQIAHTRLTGLFTAD
ncbi:MAG: hypothetical protein JWS12_381 [Candidatus Saccharibacteria bacterium]|nr:hypothetical protein [Candidatus Saccharibacteria bacterium]